jgi:hypothetical protein
MHLESKIIRNPLRIRIPKEGKALKLLMVMSVNYNSTPLLGTVSNKEVEYFDIELNAKFSECESISNYINENQ